jgi:hypothetical protein
MKSSSSTALPPDIVLRAIAICMVAFNHASITDSRPVHLGGGLNVLLMLSGYSFARFILSHDDVREVRRRIVRFVAGLWLPCFCVVLVSFVLKREWSWSEVFFVSNLLTDEHVALMYVWYPQVILQLFGMLYILTFLPGAEKWIQHRPAMLMVVMLTGSFAVLLLLHAGRPNSELLSRSLQSIAWNFFLGGAVWYARNSTGRLASSSRNLLWALTLTLSLIAFGLGVDWLRTVALTVATGIMLFTQRIEMPRSIGRAARILSQAALSIFLWHVLFLRAFDGLGLRHVHSGFDPRDTLLAGCFAITGSVGVWLMGVSLTRAWRHELPPAPSLSLRLPFSTWRNSRAGLYGTREPRA